MIFCNPFDKVMIETEAKINTPPSMSILPDGVWADPFLEKEVRRKVAERFEEPLEPQYEPAQQNQMASYSPPPVYYQPAQQYSQKAYYQLAQRYPQDTQYQYMPEAQASQCRVEPEPSKPIMRAYINGCIHYFYL